MYFNVFAFPVSFKLLGLQFSFLFFFLFKKSILLLPVNYFIYFLNLTPRSMLLFISQITE